MNEIFENDNELILVIKFLSDTTERKFSHYRQISGDRFLVDLRKFANSEKILPCMVLSKTDINFWK